MCNESFFFLLSLELVKTSLTPSSKREKNIFEADSSLSSSSHRRDHRYLIKCLIVAYSNAITVFAIFGCLPPIRAVAICSSLFLCVYHHIPFVYCSLGAFVVFRLMRIFHLLQSLNHNTDPYAYEPKLSTWYIALIIAVTGEWGPVEREWVRWVSARLYIWRHASWLRSLARLSLSLSLLLLLFVVTVLVVAYKLMYKCKLNDLNDLLYICCCCYCCIHRIYGYICAHQHLICPYNKCLYSSAFSIPWKKEKEKQTHCCVYVRSTNKQNETTSQITKHKV